MVTKTRIQTKNTKVFHGSNDYKFTDMVNHAGKVISFVMDDEGQVFYTVLNLDSATNQIDQKAWTPMDALPFPKELAQIGYGIVDNYQMPKRDDDKTILTQKQIDRKYPQNAFNSSTGILGAAKQFHVYSDGRFIYLFRQALSATGNEDILNVNYTKDGINEKPQPIVNNTLLVDRYILNGTSLVLPREIRYKYSGNKIRNLAYKLTQ